MRFAAKADKTGKCACGEVVCVQSLELSHRPLIRQLPCGTESRLTELPFDAHAVDIHYTVRAGTPRRNYHTLHPSAHSFGFRCILRRQIAQIAATNPQTSFSLFLEIHELEVDHELTISTWVYWIQARWNSKWNDDMFQLGLDRFFGVMTWQKVRGPAGASGSRQI